MCPTASRRSRSPSPHAARSSGNIYLAPFVVGGRVFVPIATRSQPFYSHDANGVVLPDPPFVVSYLTLYTFTPGQPPTCGWEYCAGQTSSGREAGHWRFSAGPGGTLQVGAELGGWQPQVPTRFSPPRPGCVAVPTRPIEYFNFETLRPPRWARFSWPTGSTLHVLSTSELWSNGARLFWVSLHDRSEGYALLRPGELHGCSY